MKVGTDSVLLGSWINSSNACNALDIGTGTGILALMLAQENPRVVVDAVEIDPASAAQAAANILLSPWAGRITVTHADISDFAKQPGRVYDLIVTNPPYYQHESSIASPYQNRKQARYSQSLCYEKLVQIVMKLLAPSGSFYLIIPASSGDLFKRIASNQGLSIIKRMKVRPLPDRDFIRWVLELKKEAGDINEQEIILEIRHHIMTDDFKQLTVNFYP